MTIYTTKPFPHHLPYISGLRFASSSSRHTCPVICRKAYPNEDQPRKFPSVEPYSIDTRPKVDPYLIETRQPVDLKETQLLKLIKEKPYNKSGKLNEAMHFFKSTVIRGYEPDVVLCTKLIKAFCHAKDVEKAIQVMDILELKGKPDLLAYNAVIDGFYKVNKIDDANQLLDRKRARGCSPNIITYNVVIGSLCRKGNLNLALKLFDKQLPANC